MERTYYTRGKRVTVEQVEDVLAVQLARNDAGESVARASDFGKSATRTSGEGEPALTLPNDEAEAFQQAGWAFVQPSQRLARAAVEGDLPDGADEAGAVFKRPSGRVLIGTGRLTVRLEAELTEEEAEAALRSAGLEPVRRLRFAPNLYEARVSNGRDALEKSVDLHEAAPFVSAEPVFVEHVGQRFTPTDPDYADQWQWNNTGAGGGTAGADVGAEEAWDVTRGAGVRVAVIDNGFDVGHEDLSAGLTATSGYFDSSSNFQQTLSGFPDGDHGTFCAGMVAARHNNGRGGCGAAPEADLMLVACLGDQVGTQLTLARAVAYAADPSTEVATANPADGADIISCSLGPNGADWELTEVLELAIESAVTNGRGGLGTAVFWASSNGDNVPIASDEVVSHPNVIAVGRSTRKDTEDDSARGDELDFLAPGVDVYSTRSGDTYGISTGTSFAAPCAAGVGALVLGVRADLSWDELRQTMRDTCDQIGGVAYDANGHNDDYGFGRVNAWAAMVQASLQIDLVTPTVVFGDVPEGETTARSVSFEVRGLQTVQFEIISGPAVLSGPAGTAFGTPLGTSVSAGPGPDVTTPVTARLWITYTGTSAGDMATGEVEVRCVQTGQTWTVPITANTVARPTSAVMLVLDRSGSMLSGAGDGRSRLDVLKEAASHFTHVIQPQNALGVVAFDEDPIGTGPGTTDVTPAGAEPFGTGRTQALSAIANHAPDSPGARTSIGDGVELAGTRLGAVTGYDHTAMVVLTDGRENEPKFLADVAGGVGDRVFGIGLGTADAINPAALTELTNGTGGYTVMTGVLDADEQFLLSKYYLQILAGITNEDIVLDPDGFIAPGQQQRIPFALTEADLGSDVMLLSTAPQALRFTLETPSGQVIEPASAAAVGARYVGTETLHYYRLTLPVLVDGQQAAAGAWHAVLEVDRAAFKDYVHELREQGDEEALEVVLAHGIRYAVQVHSYSNLRLRARLDQDHHAPGAKMTIRAHLAECGIPVQNRASVWGELKRPDGSKAQVQLDAVEPGIFEASFEAKQSGVYHVRLRARGRTMRGHAFTREQRLTGAVWRPTPDPANEPGSDGPAQTCKEGLYALGVYLTKDEDVYAYLEDRLAEAGIEMRRVAECLLAFGDEGGRPPVLERPPIFERPPVVIEGPRPPVGPLRPPTELPRTSGNGHGVEPAALAELLRRVARELDG